MKWNFDYFRYSQTFLLSILLTMSFTSSADDNVTMVTMEQIPYGFKTTNEKLRVHYMKY
jgi:hypothetical protein